MYVYVPPLHVDNSELAVARDEDLKHFTRALICVDSYGQRFEILKDESKMKGLGYIVNHFGLKRKEA
jgi:hypothetical protein